MYISLGVFMSAWSSQGQHLCRASILLCLSFYISNKAVLYMCLMERIHQLRNVQHRHESVRIIGAIIVLAGFGTVAFFAFYKPVHQVSRVDGKCRIGLKSVSIILLLVHDALMNVIIAVAFIVNSWHWLKDLPKKRQLKTFVYFIPNALNRLPATTTFEEWQTQVLYVMVSKSLVGSFVTIMATFGNLIVIYVLHGHEQAWVCFTSCTLDGMT